MPRPRPAGRPAIRRAARAAGIGLLPLGLAMMAQGAGLLGAPTLAADPGSARADRAAVADSATTGAAPGRDASRAAQGGVRWERTSPLRLSRPAPPTTLAAPGIGLDAMVVPIEVSDEGVLVPPGDVSQVGWWRRSAPLRATGGQTVLTGHSVHGGGGVMNELGALTEGDVVAASHGDRAVRYRVSSVRVWSKEQLAARAERIFAQDRGAGRLVLVTCDDWDGSDWQSNVVVTARPIGLDR